MKKPANIGSNNPLIGAILEEHHAATSAWIASMVAGEGDAIAASSARLEAAVRSAKAEGFVGSPRLN